MITKRVLIELIQNRLAGGIVPADLQGKYPKQVIDRLIGLVYSDISYKNKKAVRNMALPYTSTVISANDRYYIVLPVSPINGMSGVVWITGLNGTIIPTSNGLEQGNIMSKILPQIGVFAQNIEQNKMYFNENPIATTVKIDIIPDFNSLGENDNVCVEGVVSDIFSMVMAKMRENVSQLEEVYNNQVADTDRPQTPSK